MFVVIYWVNRKNNREKCNESLIIKQKLYSNVEKKDMQVQDLRMV